MIVTIPLAPSFTAGGSCHFRDCKATPTMLYKSPYRTGDWWCHRHLLIALRRDQAAAERLLADLDERRNDCLKSLAQYATEIANNTPRERAA